MDQRLIENPKEKIKGLCGIDVRKGLTSGLPPVENKQLECRNRTMLTVDIYNKVGMVAKSRIELSSSDDIPAVLRPSLLQDFYDVHLS